MPDYIDKRPGGRLFTTRIHSELVKIGSALTEAVKYNSMLRCCAPRTLSARKIRPLLKLFKDSRMCTLCLISQKLERKSWLVWKYRIESAPCSSRLLANTLLLGCFNHLSKDIGVVHPKALKQPLKQCFDFFRVHVVYFYGPVGMMSVCIPEFCHDRGTGRAIGTL